MSESYIGEIRVFGMSYAPKGWLLCNGQLVTIEEYTSLFALLGCRFGGNGSTTFRLPNLKGRIPMSRGQGYKLTSRIIGHKFGEEFTTEVVKHKHTITNIEGNIKASSNNGTKNTPAENILAKSNLKLYIDSEEIDHEMADGTVVISEAATDNTGVAEVNNIQPSLVMNFCICYDGIYPQEKKEKES